MRNLKRALSLAVASIMLLGMMVVGAGATSFPDVDDSHNVEAIEVLEAVKVFVGDENGNLSTGQVTNNPTYQSAVNTVQQITGLKPTTVRVAWKFSDGRVTSQTYTITRSYSSAAGGAIPLDKPE